METKIKVLHIDTELTWRGGQQQAIYLHEGLIDNGIESVFICNPGSELEKYCVSNSLPNFPLKMRGELDIFAAIKISRFAGRQEFDILHCHSAHALSLGIIAKLFNRKLHVIGVRRVDFHIGKNILSRYKYNNRQVAKIVCISQKIFNVLLEDGVPPHKMLTIRSGIDLTKFSNIENTDNVRNEFGIEQGKIIVGTIAAFVDQACSAGSDTEPHVLV